MKSSTKFGKVGGSVNPKQEKQKVNTLDHIMIKLLKKKCKEIF